MPSSILRRAPTRLRRLLADRGEPAFRSFVRRSDDRRLERTIGSAPGLRVIFGAMAREFVPERAGGFTGDVQIDLRTAGGELRRWTITIAPDRATACAGASADPRLTITLGVADFVRMAGRDLDPGKALLTGRMDLAGDFAVATRLGRMFGRPGPF